MTTDTVSIPHVRLTDGKDMPQLGYGVWQVENDVASSTVRTAIELGYRSIDTAKIYENEEGVGRAVRAATEELGVARSDMFITTKLWNDAHEHDAALRAFDDSMSRLGLDYVDLYLMHWPAPKTGNFTEAWRAMIDIEETGRARSIGVCNFAIEHLETLRERFDTQPVINQVELHPYFQQAKLRTWCADNDIYVEAWSPLGQGGELLRDPVISEIAARHQRAAAQIVIRWHLQVGNVVIPKSVTPSRIAENLDVFDFELTTGDMQQIADLDRADGRIGPDPSIATF